MFIELVPAQRYYGRHSPGWVVLVNGQPHHEPTKQGAMQFIALLPKPQEIQSMKTQTFAQAQAMYDAMEPAEDPDDLTERPLDELEAQLVAAEDMATDPEVPARMRRQWGETCLQLEWEIARRRLAA